MDFTVSRLLQALEPPIHYHMQCSAKDFNALRLGAIDVNVISMSCCYSVLDVIFNKLMFIIEVCDIRMKTCDNRHIRRMRLVKIMESIEMQYNSMYGHLQSFALNSGGSLSICDVITFSLTVLTPGLFKLIDGIAVVDGVHVARRSIINLMSIISPVIIECFSRCKQNINFRTTTEIGHSLSHVDKFFQPLSELSILCYDSSRNRILDLRTDARMGVYRSSVLSDPVLTTYAVDLLQLNEVVFRYIIDNIGGNSVCERFKNAIEYLHVMDAYTDLDDACIFRMNELCNLWNYNYMPNTTEKLDNVYCSVPCFSDSGKYVKYILLPEEILYTLEIELAFPSHGTNWYTVSGISDRKIILRRRRYVIRTLHINGMHCRYVQISGTFNILRYHIQGR